MRYVVAGCLLLALAACEPAAPPAAEPAAAPEPMSETQMAQWGRSCGLCHADGTAGAPIVGDAAAWTPRIEQGRDVILTHTIEGLGMMPPLGYCMACEEDDFIAMIEFMAGQRLPAAEPAS